MYTLDRLYNTYTYTGAHTHGRTHVHSYTHKIAPHVGFVAFFQWQWQPKYIRQGLENDDGDDDNVDDNRTSRIALISEWDGVGGVGWSGTGWRPCCTSVVSRFCPDMLNIESAEQTI